MSLHRQIKSLIEAEDRLNPLSDAEIAERLSTTVPQVVTLRRDLLIDTSARRKRKYADKAIGLLMREIIGNESITDPITDPELMAILRKDHGIRLTIHRTALLRDRAGLCNAFQRGKKYETLL